MTTIKNFLEGERIYQAGESSRGAYIIETGRVDLYTDMEFHLVTLDEGELFGALDQIIDEQRSVTAIAKTDYQLKHIPQYILDDKFNAADPAIIGMFRALLSDRERAGAFLRDQLPNEIAGQLQSDPPEIVEGSFIDEALRSTQSDVLLEVKTKSNDPAFVYVLAEHKSTPDIGLPLRLAGYMVEIWKRYAGGRAGKLRALPPIIPIVCYHGSANWTMPEGSPQ